MFPKKQRITKKEHFQRIYKNAQVFNLGYFRVFIIKNALGKTRASVIVSKKVSSLSVNRNKIKRKLRHVLISNLNLFPDNSDILIIALNSKILSEKSSQIKDSLVFLSKKLKIRI